MHALWKHVHWIGDPACALDSLGSNKNDVHGTEQTKRLIATPPSAGACIPLDVAGSMQSSRLTPNG